MAWDAIDFTVFGAMLLGVGAIYRLARRNADNTAYRFAVGVALAAAFILVWVNGAVGVIGDENNDANMMFFGVLAVGIIGAIIARFRPHGMVRALCATALTQVTIAVIAMIAGLGSAAPFWPKDILILTGFFVALWLFVRLAVLERCAGAALRRCGARGLMRAPAPTIFSPNSRFPSRS